MIETGSDEERWRMAFARILLGVLMLYYLGDLVLVARLYPALHTVRAIAPTAALLVLAGLAVFTIRPMRATSIIFLAIMSLVSIWTLLETLLKTRIFASALGGLAHWRSAFSALIYLGICSLPVIVFVVVWPLRPRLHPDAVQIEATQDS